MKITLIGGSGFVGTRLIDLLRPDGKYKLQNIDKQQSHFFPDVTVAGDVRLCHEKHVLNASQLCRR